MKPTNHKGKQRVSPSFHGDRATEPGRKGQGRHPQPTAQGTVLDLGLHVTWHLPGEAATSDTLVTPLAVGGQPREPKKVRVCQGVGGCSVSLPL